MVSYGHTILGSPAYTPSAYHQTTHYLLLLTPHTPLYHFTRSSTYTQPLFNTVLHCSKANTGGIALCGVFASLKSTHSLFEHVNHSTKKIVSMKNLPSLVEQIIAGLSYPRWRWPVHSVQRSQLPQKITCLVSKSQSWDIIACQVMVIPPPRQQYPLPHNQSC